jgi:hypothetical protein
MEKSEKIDRFVSESGHHVISGPYASAYEDAAGWWTVYSDGLAVAAFTTVADAEEYVSVFEGVTQVHFDPRARGFRASRTPFWCC